MVLHPWSSMQLAFRTVILAGSPLRKSQINREGEGISTTVHAMVSLAFVCLRVPLSLPLFQATPSREMIRFLF